MERDLYPPISRFLQNRGYYVRCEVPPCLGSQRRIDVVGSKPRKGIVAAVEAKIGNYNRVLEQACLRMFVADFVYVSFHSSYAKKIYFEKGSELQRNGIGLISVGERTRELISPIQSKYVNPIRRSNLIAVMKNLEE